jgi:hypothetical protein
MTQTRRSDAKVLGWVCYASRPRRFATTPLRSANPPEEAGQDSG